MELVVYRRREPEKTVLYQVVREHLNSFLEYADSRSAEGRGLPKYVREEFFRFLKCGILAHGFARILCRECGFNAVTAYSCKNRGICPSCAGRRMADTAAHLVDKVLPHVPVRQWVLSVPRQIRYILARDAGLLSKAVGIFVEEVFRDLRRRGKKRFKGKGLAGAVTGIHRQGNSLNVNIHAHTLALDGLYVEDASTGKLRFRRLPEPTKDDLDRVLSRVRHKVLRFLEKKGFAVGRGGEGSGGGSGEREDVLEEPSVLDMVQGASILERVGLSGDGRRVPVEGRYDDGPVELEEGPVSISSGDGWSLQAGVRIRGGDRIGLERLCKYVLRPPFAGERLTRLADGRVKYEFRRPRPDGGTHLVLTPNELLEKLAALVPPPRSHLVRYHGVLGPNSRHRGRVVPPEEAKPEGEGCRHEECRREDFQEDGSAPRPRRRRGRRERTPWAKLLKRSFGFDVLSCPKCGGRMKVIATIDEPEVIRKILRAMGLPAEAPRAEPARPPPQLEFDFDQGSIRETA